MLFKVTIIVKDNDEEEYVQSGKGSWTFNTDFARNVIIFGFVNSSSFHTYLKNDFFNFRWKRQCIDFNINGNFVAPGKKNFYQFQ